MRQEGFKIFLIKQKAFGS